MAISKSMKVWYSNLDFVILNLLTQDIWDAVTSSKLKYYESLANKLNNPKAAPKSYWKILKTFLSGTKIPLIPPLLVRNQLVSDFFVKANNIQQQFYPSKYKFWNWLSTLKPIVYFWNLFSSYCKDHKIIGFEGSWIW